MNRHWDVWAKKSTSGL